MGARPLIALTVIAADLGWVLLSIVPGFPGPGERIFQALVVFLTLAMVASSSALRHAGRQLPSASSMGSC